ncbi:J domain-containing protein [Haloarculaceae archaeon H-GB11]|nr:J domain-containing protein [Haloarculaceae archaeon H-GB11]
MLTEEQRTEATIHWPDGYDRTPADDREAYPGDLEPTRKESFQSIVDELERWGATAVRISTASQHYVDRPNIPHQHDKPDDVGVAAYYLREGGRADEWHAIACDQWATQRENARAIALWARRMRLAERCGVTTAQSTHAAAQLPSGDEDAIAVAGSEAPHEVLDVAPDAPADVVEAAARQKIKAAHPDNGGTQAAFQRVQNAREAMLD